MGQRGLSLCAACAPITLIQCLYSSRSTTEPANNCDILRGKNDFFIPPIKWVVWKSRLSSGNKDTHKLSKGLRVIKFAFPRCWFLIICKDRLLYSPNFSEIRSRRRLALHSDPPTLLCYVFHLSRAFIECIFISNMHKGRCTKCALVITSIFCLNLGIDCLDLSNTILLFEKGTKLWDAQRRWREEERGREREGSVLECFFSSKPFPSQKSIFKI